MCNGFYIDEITNYTDAIIKQLKTRRYINCRISVTLCETILEDYSEISDEGLHNQDEIPYTKKCHYRYELILEHDDENDETLIRCSGTLEAICGRVQGFYQGLLYK